jgi:hypothetical protein
MARYVAAQLKHAAAGADTVDIVGARMDEPHNSFDLSPEQQHTASLLRRLLGKAVADRYIDFCWLAAGAFALNVSRPVAAHALRELDSILRQVLAVSMEAKAPEEPENADKLDEARKALAMLGCFDEAAIRRAVDGLKPRFSHKEQIRKIVARLHFDPEGDIAARWTSLSDAFGRVHERSFHRSLEVDNEFRERYQAPFDTVVRAVAVALEGRYVPLMRRVEEIAAMPDRTKAVAAFAAEIPGALPLQWHFFKLLNTPDWLPHLACEGLLSEPMAGSEEDGGSGFRYRQWPAGNYLQRMAESADAQTRQLVAEALRAVAGSKHPDICHDGIEVLAALPAEESAPLVDLAVAWLGRGERFGGLPLAPEKLLRKLVEAKQDAAALRVARALLQIWKENGHVASLYGPHMYEHHLPSITKSLTEACGERALQLFVELLNQGGVITGRIEHEHHSSRPVGDHYMARHDPYHALANTVRRSAEMLVAEDPARMRAVIRILTNNPPKIFVRFALHVLAQNPSAAPDLAERYLLDPDLIEGSWAQDEYAALA